MYNTPQCKHKITSFTAVLALATCHIGANNALAQPTATAFTYQGELQENGSPASGLHDVRFRLYDAANAGTQLGSTLCIDNVSLVNGRFLVQLDFGSQFAVPGRFLELDVRADTGAACNNSAGFVTLGPRQAVTSVPAASFAQTAATSTTANSAATAAIASNATNLNGQPASFYQAASNLTGTLADARLSTNVPRLNAANTFTSGVSAPTFTGALNGNATSATTATTATNALNLNGQPASFYQSATNLTSGTLADARLSSNVARLNATNMFAAEATFLTQIGIGATNGTAAQLWVQRADGGTNSVNANTVLGIENNTTAYQQFFTPAASESGLLFGHTNPDPSIGAGFIYNNVAAPQGLQFRAGGNSTKMTLTSAGDLGVGTLAPTARLDVAGDMRVSGNVGIGTSTPEASLHVRSSDSLGTIIVTPGVTDTQSQLLLAENLSASNAMMARYNGSTNNLEIRGLAANVESPAHVTINRDSGAVAVHGDISIDPTTRYMSIPPAAFGAEFNLHIFSFGIDNDALIPGTNGFAHAPVNLPHGAVVTAVEMYAVDTANTNATLELTRLGLNGAGGTTMASVSTSGTSGEQSPADNSIASATIDNSQYTYTLSVSWNQSSSGSVFFTGARIQYTVTSPLP